MKDISNKITTLRQAHAQATLRASSKAILAAKSGQTPKGEVWNVARVAGIIAAKKTSDIIPYCHQISLDHVEINFEPNETEIKIIATVKAVHKTGVEMEALCAASAAALTVYDMLKPISDDIIISEVKLIEKKGGKSDFKEKIIPTAAVLVTSDSVSSGQKNDKSGKLIVEQLENCGVQIKAYQIVPDNEEKIAATVKGWIKENVELIITTGGTGLGPRDVTAEVLSKIIEREVPGISEAMRAFGQSRTPYAMLSRGIAGVVGNSLIIALPGSSKGVKESLDSILPHVFHIYPMMKGGGH